MKTQPSDREIIKTRERAWPWATRTGQVGADKIFKKGIMAVY